VLKSDLESRVGEEKIDVYADLVKKNVEVLKIIEEDGAQWRKLQDEMDKKQENVKRLFRELDGKNLSLKLSAAEVLNIKRKIRNLKKENMHLRDEVQRSLDYEPEIALNRPDLMQMDEEEVRNKVVFIAKVDEE
jgi:hypothetical protein